jgi:hypothetical protein
VPAKTRPLRVDRDDYSVVVSAKELRRYMMAPSPERAKMHLRGRVIAATKPWS